MRGVKSEDLLTIIDFLYCGQADVLEENLERFLAISKELQLKGFTGFQELEEKCKSMMEKTAKKQANGYPLYVCKV